MWIDLIRERDFSILLQHFAIVQPLSSVMVTLKSIYQKIVIHPFFRAVYWQWAPNISNGIGTAVPIMLSEWQTRLFYHVTNGYYLLHLQNHHKRLEMCRHNASGAHEGILLWLTLRDERIFLVTKGLLKDFLGK